MQRGFKKNGKKLRTQGKKRGVSLEECSKCLPPTTAKKNAGKREKTSPVISRGGGK